MKTFKLPLYNRDGDQVGTALIDDEDKARCTRGGIRWGILDRRGTPTPIATVKGQRTQLKQHIMRARKRRRVVCLNGNAMDCRKANLQFGTPVKANGNPVPEPPPPPAPAAERQMSLLPALQEVCSGVTPHGIAWRITQPPGGKYRVEIDCEGYADALRCAADLQAI